MSEYVEFLRREADLTRREGWLAAATCINAAADEMERLEECDMPEEKITRRTCDHGECGAVAQLREGEIGARPFGGWVQVTIRPVDFRSVRTLHFCSARCASLWLANSVNMEEA